MKVRHRDWAENLTILFLHLLIFKLSSNQIFFFLCCAACWDSHEISNMKLTYQLGKKQLNFWNSTTSFSISSIDVFLNTNVRNSLFHLLNYESKRWLESLWFWAPSMHPSTNFLDQWPSNILTQAYPLKEFWNTACYLKHFILCFNFEIIIDSHVRNTTEWSSITFAHIPSVVTFCKTTVQCHNQDVNVDIVKIQTLSITTRIHRAVLLQSHPLLSQRCSLLSPWQLLILSPFV